MIMSAHLSTQDMALHVHVCSSITEYHSGHGRYMFMSARLSRNNTQDMALHVHVSSSIKEYHSGYGVTYSCLLVYQGIPLRIWRYMFMSARLSRNTTQDMALHVHVFSSITEYHSGHGVTCSCLLFYHRIPLRICPLHVHVSSSIKEYHSEHGRYMFMSARLLRNTTQNMAVTCSCLLVYQGIPLRTWPIHVHVSSSIQDYHSVHGRYMFMSACLSTNTAHDHAAPLSRNTTLGYH